MQLPRDTNDFINAKLHAKKETFTCGVSFSKFGFLPKIILERVVELVAGCKASVQNYGIQK